MEENKIKVYVKVNENDEITAINSEIFIEDMTGWRFVDEGYSDKYAHAQGLYLEKPLMDDEGHYRYKFIAGKIVESWKWASI